MLKTPQYDRQVQSTGYRTTTPRVGNTAVGLERGIDQLTGEVKRYELKAAELQAEETVQSFVRESTSLLLSGDDPYYGTRGKDSVDRAQPTIQALEELKRDHLARVKHPDAHRLLSRSLESRMTSEMGRIQARAMDGQKEWDQSLAKTGIEQAAEQVMLYVNDPARVRAAEVSIRDNLRVTMEGMPVEAIDEATQNAVSAALSGGIMAEIDRSPGEAQRLFNQYEGKLEAEDKTRVKTKLKARVDYEQVAGTASSIRSAAPGNLKAQLAAARKQFGGDAKLRDQLMRRITNDYNLDEAARKEGLRQSYERMADDVMIRGVPVDKLLADNPAAVEALDARQLSNLRSLEATASKNQPIKTNWGVWTKLMGLKPDELRDVDPTTFRGHLSDSEYKGFVKAWQKANAGDDSHFTYLQGNSAYVNGMINQVTEDDKVQNELRNFVQSEISRFEQSEGRNIKRDELNVILDDFFMKREVVD